MTDVRGEWMVAFERHALPGRGYVPLPVCLRVIRGSVAYNPVRPPFPFLSDVLAVLRRLLGVTQDSVRGYWAPDSPLSAFHGASGWVELVLDDRRVVALVSTNRLPRSVRAYPSFVHQIALDVVREWAQKVQ